MSQKPEDSPASISQEDAEVLLQPHLPKLKQVIFDAWAEWGKIPAVRRSKMNTRARAAILHSFMVHFAKVHFPQTNQVTPLERRGLFLIGIGGVVTIRFKKFRYGKRTSNIQTNQQIDFDLQIDLPGIPKAARLTVGYILDASQTAIKDVLITFRQAQRLLWDFSIAGTQAQVVRMPLPAAKSADATVRVRAKERVQKSSE
jgi:hypothetical protein